MTGPRSLDGVQWKRAGVVLSVALLCIHCSQRRVIVIGEAASESGSQTSETISTAAYEVIARSDLTITEEASDRLSVFIQSGAGRVADSGGEEEAVENIRIFARALIANASFDMRTGGKHIDAQSFQIALGICPLYPFC